MATPDSLAATPAAEVQRMVGGILAGVDAGLAAHGPRLVLFTSFDPDVCLEVKRRCGVGAGWGDVVCVGGGGEWQLWLQQGEQPSNRPAAPTH